MSSDEMLEGFDSQGMNSFAYVRNSPTSAVDPTGHGALSAGAIAVIKGANEYYDFLEFSPEFEQKLAVADLMITGSAPLLWGLAGPMGWWVLPIHLVFLHWSAVDVVLKSQALPEVDSVPGQDGASDALNLTVNSLELEIVGSAELNVEIVDSDGDGKADEVVVHGTTIKLDASESSREALANELYNSHFGGNVAQTIMLVQWLGGLI